MAKGWDFIRLQNVCGDMWNHVSYVVQNDLKIYIIIYLSCFGNSCHKMSFWRWLNYTAAGCQQHSCIALIVLITFQNRTDITIHTSIVTSDKNHPRSYVNACNNLEIVGFLWPQWSASQQHLTTEVLSKLNPCQEQLQFDKRLFQCS